DEFAAATPRSGAPLTAARHGLPHAADSLAARGRATAEATDHYVHEQPWRAIAVGATLGLLLGFALARR
ncbi:MAG: glycine zipper domain-containing protein, partial [Pseudomonadota bacterium]